MSLIMLEYKNLGALCLSYFIAIVSPGPSFLVIFKNSIMFSKKSGIFTAIGTSCGIACQAFYVLLFVTLIDSTSLLFQFIKFACSAYLICLGIYTFLNRQQVDKKSVKNQNKSFSFYHSLKEGFFVDVLNPLALSFFLGIFTVYIPKGVGYTYKGIVWFLIVFIGFCWFISLALLMNQEKIRNFIKVLMGKKFSIFVAILFIYLGINLAFK